MKLKNYLIIVMFFTLFIFGCSTNPPPDADSGEVYATNVSFSLPTTNYYVGDEIKLDDLSVKLEPSKVTVKPKFTVDNSSLGVINDGLLTLLAEGELSLTVSVLSDVNTYKTYTVKLNISTKPVYAESVEVDNDTITVNYNNAAVNLVTILPENYNKGVLVEYEHGNVLEYDYETGEITPIAAGTDTVTVIVNKSDTETITKSFEVIVTNNIYATGIESIKINNKTTTENIILFTGEEGEISSVVEPNNYNLSVNYSCSNSLITVNGDNFTVGNTAGTCELICTVFTQDSVITKSVTVTILPMLIEINFDLKLNNDSVSELYVGTVYNAFISTNLPDYDNVIFTNCNYVYVNENSYNITLNSAGETKIDVLYTIASFIGSYEITGSKTLSVYNPVTDINFALQNGTELIPSLGVYTLYLPNSELFETAVSNNELVFADLTVSAKNTNTKQSVLEVTIEGDSILLSGNRIKANKLGESKIIVTANDISNFRKEFTVNVLPLKATEILTETEVELFLNGTSDYPNSFELDYSVMPSYAYNKEVEINSNSNVVEVNDLIVTALTEGLANITLTCDDIVKTIAVTVSYYESSFVAKLDDEVVSENTVVELKSENTYYLQGEVYSGSTKLNREVSCFVNGEQLDNSAIYKLCFTEQGNYNIKLKYKGFEVNFVANVTLNNPIISANFTDENSTVNMFNLTTMQLSYEINKTDQTKPTTSSYYFESNNSLVVRVNGENLEILSCGTATISLVVDGNKVDELFITVINKEINYISNLSQFLAIKNKPNSNYVVTNNLDFTSFTYDDSFNFGGEIDFNGKTISNLKTPMFKTIENAAVVKNIVVSGVLNLDVSDYYNESTNPTAYYSLIAFENNGTINNLKFDNFEFNLLNKNSVDLTTVSLVVTTNNGVVSNITLTNFEFNANFSSSKVAGVIYSGLVNTNNGEILAVTGDATYLGFTRISGVALYNYNKIADVTLSQTFNVTQSKNQIGVLSYRCMPVNDKNPEISNINLTTTVVNTQTLTFAGFVYDASEITINNVKLSFTFNGDYNDETTFLIYKTVSDSNVDYSKFEIVETNKNFEYAGN